MQDLESNNQESWGLAGSCWKWISAGLTIIILILVGILWMTARKLKRNREKLDQYESLKNYF